MKLIFLDIDGVLNSHDWYERRPSRGDRPIDEIDPDAAARVQRLCDETGAQIVVSSTWRLLYKLPRLREVLGAKGLRAPLIGVTPRLPQDERGAEIQLWLDKVPALRGWTVESMVILDDDFDMLHLHPWLVRTPFETGFTDAHILDAKCVLAQAMPSPSGGDDHG